MSDHLVIVDRNTLKYIVVNITMQTRNDMIKKIVIKGYSGFCPVNEAYKDKLILCEKYISYIYIPVEETDINPIREWKYTTNSPLYKKSFKQITGMISEFLNSIEEGFCTDIGGIDFELHHDDGELKKYDFSLPGDSFKELFDLIKVLIPGTEYKPAVLLTEEDFENNMS